MGRHTPKAKPVQGVSLQKNNKTNMKKQLQNYIQDPQHKPKHNDKIQK